MRIAIVDKDSIVLQNSVNIIQRYRPADEIYAFEDECELIEFLRKTPCDVVFMEPHRDDKDGIAAVRELKSIYPKVNIIFLTSHDEYYRAAMELHISGYVLKPLTRGDIEKELSDLRYPHLENTEVLIKVRCFDEFEVRETDGELIRFERSKAKELFAYLIHKRGINCTLREAAAILFEDEPFDIKKQNYMQKIISSMMNTLKKHKVEGVILKGFNEMRIDVSKVECDYYRFVDQKAEMDYSKEEKYLQEYEWT